MRIIIIGAGVGGCASFLFLRKYLPADNHSIKLIEAHANPLETSTIIGGGLGLAPNGLRTLSLIDEALPRKITSLGFEAPMAEFRTGPRDQFLGLYVMGRKERYGWSNLMVQRATVHECILEEAIKADAGAGDVQFGRKVASVDSTGTDRCMKVTFEDGSTEEADLVIGADGRRSTIRDFVAGKHVDGLNGIGGFVPLSYIEPYVEHTQSPLIMTWGSMGFFGFSPIGSGPATKSAERKAMWWSVYASDTPATPDSPRAPIKQQLQARFRGFEGAIPKIIDALCTGAPGVSDIIVFPRYRLPEFLERWDRPGAVLVGDAGHIALPESGQGVSFAVEDAATFAMLLKRYLEAIPDEAKAAECAGQSYSQIRKPRVEKTIIAATRNANNKRGMGPWQRWIRDWFIWIWCKLARESSGDELFAHKVEEAVDKHLTEKGY
ncbi:FAD/NAD P-binding domain-containing protein [Gloeophyllum trabeum ATCC 11539]|uniref:FAD/NAD P-binding domain-containing protein n=1 Tax=Gloeophyllum trabeum (strain ATCC 11539 / FP-39264 / Madison 617) TaxID=670483 RepID=S7RYW4_GLOTA|nr:FAD/NAD P-binding domain-containing protein [Gloeophyllum trabeum ATCC 11539]EPQ60150.1 FAD/NAD P-binding domain-containing protein [Gloeophyllum trabeum ATCC 11539]